MTESFLAAVVSVRTRARLLGRFVASVTVLLASPSARADDKAVCLDASSQAQTLRDAHKLLAARDELRVCARAVCPTVVRRDCTTWLNDVERALPTVVLSLKDREGHDVITATVTLDGKPFVTVLTGAALPVDPGAHAFRFEVEGGSALEQQVLVGEGQRDLIVAVHFAPAAVQPLPMAPVALPARESNWRTVGWAIGGVGVVGLVVGGVFGGLAVADKGSANCTGDRCANFGDVNSAKTAAHIADAGLIAGGVLAVAGGALLVFGRGSPKETSTRLAATPLVVSNGGGLVVRGAW